MKKQDISEKQVNHIYLAIGSNLGNRVQNIQISKFELERFKIKILKSSSHYISESWPNPLMPMYVNIVLKVKTNLNPLEILKVCNSIESKLGRIRSEKNSPRPCDIDIIDYNGKILNKKKNKLILPHPRMTKRNFVLLPLFEVNKSWKHAKLKMNIVELINTLPIKDLRSIKQL